MKKILLIILTAAINIGTPFSKEINWDTELIISNLKKCENKEFRNNCIDLEKLPDGTTYYGEFSNSIREGYGVAIFNDESRYEGIFKNGWRFSGTQKYKNGGTYTGSFKNGARHGDGKYLFPDGTLYEGGFQNGNYAGKATIKYASGDIYIGDLKDLKFDGEGEYSSKNGQIYRGQYKDGKRHGTGRLQYVNGDIYEGEFEKGSYSGHGILKYKNGEIYIGNFENGSASGFGEYKFQDGTKYIGGFNKGRFSGRGIEMLGEEIISRQGIWDDGELINAEAFDIDQLSTKLNIKSQIEIENLNSLVRDAFRSLRKDKDFVDAESYISSMYDPKKSIEESEIKSKYEIINKLNNIKKLLTNDNAKEFKITILDDKINDIQRMSIEELKYKSKKLTNDYPSGHYFHAMGQYYDFLYIIWTSPSKTSDYAKIFLNENNIRAIAFSDYEDSTENQCKYRTIAFTSYFTMSGLENNFDQRQKIGKRAKYALDFLNLCLESNQKNEIAFLYSIEQYIKNLLSIDDRLKINSLQSNLSEQSNEEIISLKRRRGHILRSAQKFDQAKIEFTEAIKIAKDNHIYDWLSDLEIALSILLIDEEKYNEAQEILIANLAQANFNGSSNWYKCNILEVLARSYQHQNNFENAITLLKSCIDIVDTERKEMITTSQISDKAFYANGLYGSFYENLAKLLIDSDRISEAHLVLDMLKEEEQFEFIRRSRDADTRISRIGYTSTEQTWVTRYRQIAGKLAALGAEEQTLQKSAKQGLTSEQKQRQQDLKKDLAVARKAFDAFLLELQDSLVKQGPARSVEVLETSQNALRETQALLKELGNDTVLLQYFVTDDKVGMLLTTSGVQLARTTAIKSQELNRQIFEFRRSLRDPKANTLPAAKALYQLLLFPVEQDLVQAGAKNIMLSLDGAMRYLPFSALHDGRQHLVQRWNMPMYTSVTKNKLRDAVTPQWQAAGLGLTRAVGKFSALPAVKGEMSSIVKTGVTGVLPGEVYLDEAFNAARFKDVSQRKFQLMHVASHFQFSPGTEINSFLLLGDGQQLTLGDIRTQNYRFDNVDLLTLSACDTGLGGGRDAQGREIEGFGVIAQQQGAKAVLATLWPVADQSTATLMADMYKQRQDKSLTKIEALRQAQISLLSQPKYAHPFYWAPFILMGNWK
jgi:CHAT domain-containing protein